MGIDLNQDMLDVARASSINTINWKNADITDLPFDSQQFDIVICQQIIQFIPDKQKALNECFRLLKPQGKLVIAVWKSTNYLPGWKALQDSLSEIIGEPYILPAFAFDEPDELTKMAINAGFQFVDLAHIIKQSHFNNVADFVTGVVGGSQNMLGRLSEVTANSDNTDVIKQKNESKISYLYRRQWTQL